MSLDNLIRLVFSADTKQAQAEVKGLDRVMSDALNKDRERWKLSIYQEKARAAEAKVAIAEKVRALAQEQNANAATAKSAIALAKAEEQVTRARNGAILARKQATLRAREIEQAGASGLDRMALEAGLNARLNARGLAIQGLSSVAQQVGGGLPGGLGAIASAATTAAAGAGVLATALSVGLVGALAAAAALVTNIVGQLGQAVKDQKDDIIAVTQIAQVVGDRGKARGIVSDFNRALSKESGGLVNTTESRQIGIGFLDDVLKGGGDAGQAAKIATGLAGLTSGDSAKLSALQNVLGDYFNRSQTVDQLRGRDVFNDIGLNKILIPKLEALGVKDLASVPIEKLSQIMAESVDTIWGQSRPEIDQSVSGLLSKFNNKLFDKYEGFFSVSRDLDTVQAGDQTVFGEFSKTVTLIFGPGGTLDRIGGHLAKLGISYRQGEGPMESLYRGLQGVNGWLEKLNAAIDGFTKNISNLTNTVSAPLQGVGAGVKAVAPGLVDGYNFLDQGLNNIGRFFGWSGYSGFYPAADGWMPLHKAIASEVANKPPGSRLIIANSSEAVIPADQWAAIAGQLARPAAGGWGGGMINLGGITINQQPGQSAEALADLLLETLDQRLSALMIGNA